MGQGEVMLQDRGPWDDYAAQQQADVSDNTLAPAQQEDTPPWETAGQAAPQPQPAPIQGAQPGAQAGPDNLPYDPLGQGDIGFANKDAAEANSRPPQSDQWVYGVTHGILNGRFKSSEDLSAFNDQLGLPPATPELRAQWDKLFENLKNGGTLGGVQPLEYGVDPASVHKNDVLPESVDAAARGLVPFGLDDELDALVTTATHGGSLRENLAKSRATRDYDEEHHFAPRLAGELVSAALLPSGAVNAGRIAAIDAVKLGIRSGLSATTDKAILRTLAGRAARGAVAKQLGVEGAAYGAATGAGSADGNLADRALGGAEGGLEGGATGAALGVAGGQASRFFPKMSQAAERSAGQNFQQAAERQGVDYMAADVPGAFKAQVATAVANSTAGTVPIAKQAEQNVASLGLARDRIAGTMGPVSSDEAGVGQTIRRGIDRFMAKADERTNQLYSRIPIDEAAPAALANTRLALGDLTKGFTSNRELSALWSDSPQLLSTAKALADGKALSWGDLKAFRSLVGAKIGRPSLTSDGNDIERLRKLYAGLSEDMRATAAQQGPGALRAFERANGFARAKATRVENTFKKLLGDDYQNSPESAFRNLMDWSKAKGGNFGAVARLVRSLPEEDAESLRASVFGMMGKATARNQDASQKIFSPAEFMASWGNMSERAKSVLFQGEHRKAIDDIVMLASGMKASNKFANTSRTGLGVAGLSSIYALHEPVTGALNLAGQYGAGMLLSSPRVAKWLASLGKKPNVPAIREHIKRLGAIARSEPALADQILGWQDELSKSLGMAPDGKPTIHAGPIEVNHPEDQ